MWHIYCAVSCLQVAHFFPGLLSWTTFKAAVTDWDRANIADYIPCVRLPHTWPCIVLIVAPADWLKECLCMILASEAAPWTNLNTYLLGSWQCGLYCFLSLRRRIVPLRELSRCWRGHAIAKCAFPGQQSQKRNAADSLLVKLLTHWDKLVTKILVLLVWPC